MYQLTSEDKKYVFDYLYKDEADKETALISLIDDLQTTVIEQQRLIAELTEHNKQLQCSLSSFKKRVYSL